MRLRAVTVVTVVTFLAVGPGTTAVVASAAGKPPLSTSPAPAGSPATTTPQPPAATAPQPPLVNEQLVVAKLGASGLPVSAELINRIVATDVPVQEVFAQTSTTNVRNLTNTKSPKITGNTVSYSVGGSGQTSAATQASFGKPLPVALHAGYSTSGQGASGIDPSAVAGLSGALSIRYTVTNTAVEKQQITYQNAAKESTTQEQPVFAPFVGSLVAVLADGVSLGDSGQAVVSTTAEGKTALQWNLVLYPPLGNYQQDLAFTVNGNSLEIPSVKMEVIPVTNDQDPAVGFSANLLSESVTGNQKLAGGLEKVDQSTTKLASSASRLTAGQAKQTKGTEQGLKGSQGLETGSAQLTAGLEDLAAGLNQLSGPAGLPTAVTAAGALASGVSQLAAAIGKASNPALPALNPAAGGGPPSTATLVQAVRLAQGALQAAAAGAGAAVLSAGAAAVNIEHVILANCPGTLSASDCTKLQSARNQSALAAAQSGGVGAGLVVVNNRLLSKILSGLLEVSSKLRSENTTSPGVYEGLITLQKGLKKSVAALDQLSGGADKAVGGAKGLTTGASQLSTGLAALSSGAGQLQAGSKALANGASDLQSEGTSKVLNQVIDSSSQPGLAGAYLQAASARANQAAPYPPPAGAVSRVAYVFSLDAPAFDDGPSLEALAIAGVFLLGLIVLVVRRLRRPGPRAVSGAQLGTPAGVSDNSLQQRD